MLAIPPHKIGLWTEPVVDKADIPYEDKCTVHVTDWNVVRSSRSTGLLLIPMSSSIGTVAP